MKWAIGTCMAVALWAWSASPTSAQTMYEQYAADRSDPIQAVAFQRDLDRDGDVDRADRWRYRRYNGRWWYWTPNNSWVYWSGGSWTPYRAGAVVGPRYRTYRSYDPYWNDGFYDRGYYRGYGPRWGYRGWDRGWGYRGGSRSGVYVAPGGGFGVYF